MSEINIIRHWDLILHPDGNEQRHTQIKEDNCILDGEITGHHHRLSGTATVEIATEEPAISNGYYRWFVKVKEKQAKLTHEEHDTIILQPWRYDAWVQREYDPIEERKVID
jgi:hypothetical protein